MPCRFSWSPKLLPGSSDCLALEPLECMNTSAIYEVLHLGYDQSQGNAKLFA